MVSKIFKLFFGLFLLLIIIAIPKSVQAQFSGDYGFISGSVRWGTENVQFDSIVTFSGQTTGFQTSSAQRNFSSDNLPPDTYTVTGYIKIPKHPSTDTVLIGSQTVSVAAGQTVTDVNFDASTVTGLVKGSLKVNDSYAPGRVQFCSPAGTCPTVISDGAYGPWTNFGGQFIFPISPGSYRVHVTTDNNLDIGILPVTIEVGQLIDLTETSVSVPMGPNVSVTLSSGIKVVFPQVTTEGYLSVITTSHPQGGQQPSQYRFLGNYYELTTTATYIGPVTVKFTYSDAEVHGQESNLKLFHWDGTIWQDITVSVDTVNNVITGSAPNLSPFAIGDLLNSPPTVDAGGSYSVDEGGSVQVSATGSDPENGALTYAWDLDNNGIFELAGQSVAFSADGLDGPTSKTIKVQVTDGGGLIATDEAIVEVTNVAPIATFDVTSPLDEGGVSNLSLANSFDAGTSDTAIGFHYSFACDGQDSSLAADYATADTESTASCPYADNGNYSVKGRIFDKDDSFTTYGATVVVSNVAPIIEAITAPTEPVQVNTAINANANFTDPGTSDTHTAIWDWGDGNTSSGNISGGVASGNHTYASAGVYTLKVTLTDDDGGSDQETFQFVVVYDPDGGFVTGGGWIDSPSGAYTANTSLTGKANFGFVSKYQQGANIPTGQTEFQFKVADFNFKSTIYEWLVVAGPNTKYKGSGTINGQGDYGFMLTARDGQVNGGGGIDKFRIKIWDKSTGNIIYDNQIGVSDDADATDAIEGGSVVIHS